jgi:hypothetical protein
MSTFCLQHIDLTSWYSKYSTTTYTDVQDHSWTISSLLLSVIVTISCDASQRHVFISSVVTQWNSETPASRPCWYSSSALKEFVPEGKRVNAKFYKGAMDRHLKRVKWARPAAFCFREFFCCTIMRPSTKLQVFANFCLPLKNVTTIYTHPPYSPDLSPPDYLLFLHLKCS